MATDGKKLFDDLNREIFRVRMVGVGGAGMCGLAEVLLRMGYRVDGYDRTASERTKKLSDMGAAINISEFGGAYGDDRRPDLVVYSAAISQDSPELTRARELNAALMTRAELLGRVISSKKTSIAVAGVHGKSTTTSMLGEILKQAPLSPTVLVGAEYASFGGAALIGAGDIIAVEACEYSDSFLSLFPSISVITNIDFDHADYFPDLRSVKRSFKQFASQTERFVIANAADSNSVDVYYSLDPKERAKWRFFYCDTSKNTATPAKSDLPVIATASDIFASAPRAAFGKTTRFRLRIRNDFSLTKPADSTDGAIAELNAAAERSATVELNATGELNAAAERSATVELNATGAYNIENALAAAAAATLAGVDMRYICDGLREFSGVRKRFEYLGAVNGMDIVDDYAHHPSEIKPALASARSLFADRREEHGEHGKHGDDKGAPTLWCVFQPHTYSRTRAFFDEFTRCFADADRTLLADVFAAREPDPGNVSSEKLAEAIRKNGGDAMWFAGGFSDIAEYLLKNGKPGDLILTMGAGLASNVAEILLATK